MQNEEKILEEKKKIELQNKQKQDIIESQEALAEIMSLLDFQ